ncbi:MetQ/NlpA family ABC transporter substrate-binding protein [Fusobacterium sp. FSA-380-WT-3A]|uniref:MetQ/NlpA family ABC transporter substrate-binding protein n=1 Tax=Fusobacterium sp. FSA-380-WT-3A TaxID=2725304 RepID=UPI00197DB614|nr:MetQ/NlpA family ABC transporter substrate-binding protein [Fusobacterium sp. FSA-380-WT-3A]
MKKNFRLLALTGLLSLALGATSFGATLKVGATPVPHAEILEVVKPELAKEGIELKIVEFTDYVTPNLALNDGELDANFFQHYPYLEKFAEERKLDLANAGNVHVEPLGLFSKKYSSLDDIKKGATVAIPNDPSNGGRALILLHNNGIITLKDPTNLYSTEFDIAKNPKKLKFKPLEAAQLPRVLTDIDFAVINGNFAMEGGLNPTKDALVIEGKESPYANIIAVRTKDLDKPEIKSLVKALQSEKVADFIEEKYNGSVVKAF